jgi:hypothetical protein
VLEPRHLPRHADTAEKRKLPEPREPLAEPQLLDRSF